MVDVSADMHQGRIVFKWEKRRLLRMACYGLLFDLMASSREENCGGLSQTDVTCACSFLYDSVFIRIL